MSDLHHPNITSGLYRGRPILHITSSEGLNPDNFAQQVVDACHAAVVEYRKLPTSTRVKLAQIQALSDTLALEDLKENQ